MPRRGRRFVAREVLVWRDYAEVIACGTEEAVIERRANDAEVPRVLVEAVTKSYKERTNISITFMSEEDAIVDVRAAIGRQYGVEVVE